MYSLIVTAKLNDVDPQAWLADVLARIATHPNGRIDELLEADGDASSTLLYTAYAQTLHADGQSPADDVVRKVADEFFKRFAARLSAADNSLPSDAPQPAGPSGQHAAVFESAPGGKGGKSWKAWTSRS